MNAERDSIPTGRGLAGKFLIAMPGLQDGQFEKTV